IARANGVPGTDEVTIDFGIGSTGSKQTIVLNGVLPVVTRSHVFIDGWSQGGAGYFGSPLVDISGGVVSNGHRPGIEASGCTVRGLAVHNSGDPRNKLDGIGIRLLAIPGVNSCADNWIYACYVGTDDTGKVAQGNGQIGIWIGPDVTGTNVGYKAGAAIAG